MDYTVIRRITSKCTLPNITYHMREHFYSFIAKPRCVCPLERSGDYLYTHKVSFRPQRMLMSRWSDMINDCGIWVSSVCCYLFRNVSCVGGMNPSWCIFNIYIRIVRSPRYVNLSNSKWHDINSSRLSDAYMRQCIMATLVQIIACCLLGAIPLSEPMLTFHQLNH